jgi:hypothetical protein
MNINEEQARQKIELAHKLVASAQDLLTFAEDQIDDEEIAMCDEIAEDVIKALWKALEINMPHAREGLDSDKQEVLLDKIINK